VATIHLVIVFYPSRARRTLESLSLHHKLLMNDVYQSL
jgi:hypothetical protein